MPNANSSGLSWEYTVDMTLAKSTYKNAEEIYYWGSMVPLILYCASTTSKGKKLVRKGVYVQKKWLTLAATNYIGERFTLDETLYQKYIDVFNKGFRDGERLSKKMNCTHIRKIKYGSLCKNLMPFIIEEPEFYYPDAQ